jgi:hypothetical protein
VRVAMMRKRNHEFDREPIEEIALLCRSSYVYICTRKFCPMTPQHAPAKRMKTLDTAKKKRQGMPAEHEEK